MDNKVYLSLNGLVAMLAVALLGGLLIGFVAGMKPFPGQQKEMTLKMSNGQEATLSQALEGIASVCFQAGKSSQEQSVSETNQ